MTPLMLLYYYFLASVHGAVFPGPAPTRPARLDERQGFVGVATVWSPTIVGTTVGCTFGRYLYFFYNNNNNITLILYYR